jgi:hypothetical protein
MEALDGDGGIKVEVVTSKDQLDKRLKELDEEGYTLVDDAKKTKAEKPEKKSETEKDDLEKERQRARKAKEHIIKEEGKEKADKLIAYAAVCASIKACLELDIPIRQDMFGEYNRLCKEVYPEKNSEMFLFFAYAFIDRMREEGVKSLE